MKITTLPALVLLLLLAPVATRAFAAHGAQIPATPSGPAPGGGQGGGPGNGGGPAGPTGPSGPTGTPAAPTGPSTATPTGGTGGATTGGGAGAKPGGSTGAFSSQDLMDWQLWWTFHRDEFVQLKSTLARGASAPSTGDEALLGASTRGAELPDAKRTHETVVPALLAALQGERNQDVLSSCIVALAKIGRGGSSADAPAIEAAIRPFLSDPLQEVAETAALALGLNATQSSAQLLVDLALDDERGRALVGQSETPYRTRAFACYGLGLLGRDAVNPDVRRFVAHHLMHVFEVDRSSTRDVKTAVLLALSLVPLEAVRTAPAAEGKGAGAAAARVSPSAESVSGSADAVLEWLLRVWSDRNESEFVRSYAAPAAARIASNGSRAIVDAWKETLCAALRPGASPQAVMQQSAVMALGMLTDNDADALDEKGRQTLMQIARDGEALARRFAFIAVARAGARDGAGESTDVNRAAVRAFLLEELRQGSSAVRPWVALAAGVGEALISRAGHEIAPETQAALLKGLRDHKSPGESGAWCIANALARQQDARDFLLETVLDNGESPARSHSALALGLLGWDGAVIPLRKVLPEARYRPYLLRDTAIALGLLGSREAVNELLRMLGDTTSLASMSAVASALGYIGDARALEPLVTMLRKGDRPDRVRAFAAAALGGICDRDMLPWNAEIAFSANYWVTPATLYEPGGATGILDLL